MYKLFLLVFLLNSSLLLAHGVPEKSRKGAIGIELNDSRKVNSHDIGRGLTLRVTKDSSVSQRDFGWIAEVVENTENTESRNLLFQNPTGSTADASQVYAWQIGKSEFPNKRRLKVTGYPLYVTITLKNPRSDGTGPAARFVLGKLKITWEWKH